MAEYYGIGVMSGSSLDGMDLCAVKLKRPNTDVDSDWSYFITHAETIDYSADWIDQLKAAETLPANKLAKLHYDYGHLIGHAVSQFIKEHKISAQFVSSHGHTIFHQPENGFTLQLGEGEAIASHLSVPLVTNFRAKDVALGGVGAPLVPAGEKFLFPKHNIFLNLGGIANVTCNGNAFDICPCNMLLNYLAEIHQPSAPFDDKGQLAARGSLQHDLLLSLNSLSYYKLKPPKSLGREWFHDQILPLLQNEYQHCAVIDILNTAVEHITDQIKDAIKAVMSNRHNAESDILITGGGYLNDFLMSRLQDKLAKLGITVVPTNVQTVKYKEALIFAFLGLRTLLGLSNVSGSLTGASQDSIGGSIHMPAYGEKTHALFR